MLYLSLDSYLCFRTIDITKKIDILINFIYNTLYVCSSKFTLRNSFHLKNWPKCFLIRIGLTRNKFPKFLFVLENIYFSLTSRDIFTGYKIWGWPFYVFPTRSSYHSILFLFACFLARSLLSFLSLFLCAYRSYFFDSF